MNAVNRLIADILCNKVNSENLSKINEKQWDEIITRSGNLGVDNIIYYYLKNYNLIPEKYLKHLKIRFKQIQILNYLQKVSTIKLIKTLKDHFIRAIPFKGIYLLDSYYKDLGIRSMGDVDLLISKEDLPEVEKIVEDLGFSYKPENCTKEWFDKNYYRSGLYTKGLVELEIHWDILPNKNPLNFRVQDIWENSTSDRLFEINVETMPLEIHLIYLCIHVSYCHFFNHNSIKRLLDIHHIVSKSTINWKDLIAKSIEYKMENFVGITLECCKRIFETQIDNQIIKNLISEKTLKMYDQIISVDQLFESRKEENPDVIMINQRLIQFIGMNEKFEYINLLSTDKAASGKWISALYRENPNSDKVLEYNWKYFKEIIPLYYKLCEHES